MSSIHVAIVGATGETGASIVNGLLAAGNYKITALTRPSSLDKPATLALKDRGITVAPAELTAEKEDELAKVLQDVDVVISAIAPAQQYAQIPLANAAKKANVKRFIPCAFLPVAPPGGVLTFRDQKEEIYNHIKVLRLPYTIIDVGWWYQISVPRLPSGKIDYFHKTRPMNTLIADGNKPMALTDVRDVGTWVAKIAADDRTLNKYVLAYDEVLSPNQVYDRLEQLSGEKLPREYTNAESLEKTLHESREASAKDPSDYNAMLIKAVTEYQYSWGVRGDNTPENAKYLGYLTTKELYPETEFKSFDSFLTELLEGKLKPVYEQNEAVQKANYK